MSRSRRHISKPPKTPESSSGEFMESGYDSDNPDCMICLSKIKDPCAMSGCAHRYCFGCVSEWCKINASCPACKEPIVWLIDKNDELYAIVPPLPQKEEALDPIFIVSSEDSMDDFIVPDERDDGHDAEWGGRGEYHRPARKRKPVATRRSKRQKLQS